jgi:hypothetical protein
MLTSGAAINIRNRLLQTWNKTKLKPTHFCIYQICSLQFSIVH